MVKDINIILNKLEGKKAEICDDKCKYFRFPHLEVACVLSSVFSVKKGEVCFEKEVK